MRWLPAAFLTNSLFTLNREGFELATPFDINSRNIFTEHWETGPN